MGVHAGVMHAGVVHAGDMYAGAMHAGAMLARVTYVGFYKTVLEENKEVCNAVF